MSGPASTLVVRVNFSVAFRAPALPAQSWGGGIGRGAKPPSEAEKWIIQEGLA